MTTETRLRQALQQAAATIPEDDTRLEQVVRRGRSRRSRNRGAVVAGLAALAVTVGRSSRPTSGSRSCSPTGPT